MTNTSHSLAMVIAAASSTSAGRWPFSAISRALVQENKWRAQRYGIHGSFVDEVRRETVPVAEVLDETIERIRDDAEALGCAEDLERARDIVARGTSADGQIAVWTSALGTAETPYDALKAVKSWIAAETLQ